VLEPVIARYRGIVKRRYFRGDAAFANPEMYELLETEGVRYTIRLPANNVLQKRITYLLKRPVGRPPREVRRYYASFTYQAQRWSKPRRVVAKGECIRASSTRASASSSPTWRGQPSASSPSTTSAVRHSSGSKRARTRSNGHGCPAAPSPPMPSGCSFTRSLITSAISCARWRSPKRLSRGR